MSQLGALFYADSRAFLNDARRALRSPGRLVLWGFYALSIVGFVWLRTAAWQRHPAPPGPADLSTADFFICSLLVVLAAALATGRGAIGIFRTRAEARFIIGSPVPAPLAIAYLQTRETLAQGARFLFSFLYFIFVFAPRHVSTAALIADLAFIGGIFAATAAILVPRRLLHGPAAFACAIAGSACVVVAAAPAARDAVVRFPLPRPPGLAAAILRYVPAWHPGQILLEPNVVWLLAVVALAASATAILAGAGRDAYPELYALSVARINRIERWRQRRGFAGGNAAAASPPQRAPAAPPSQPRQAHAVRFAAPGGVLVFIWKAVVNFRRQKHRVYVVGGAVGWFVAGVVLGRVFSSSAAELFYTAAGACIQIMLIIGISATGSLADEVRRPLFWLADTPLYERLAALVLAEIWRPVLSLELVAGGFAAGGGRFLELLFIALGLPALVTLLAGVGFAAYAVFPSATDWRGPVVALRLLISLILVIPPFALFGLVAAFFGASALALIGAALVALLEAAVLVGIAAWRLDGRIDRLAA